MDGETLKFGFLHNHALLLSRLSATSILPDVYAAGIVSATEKEVILKQLTECQKLDQLLDAIHKEGQADANVYSTFFELLSVTSGQNLQSVLKKIKDDSTSKDVQIKFEYGRQLLGEKHRMVMDKCKSITKKSLLVEDILPNLISIGIISYAEKLEIQSAQGMGALALYSVISNRGSHAFKMFVEVLLEFDKYKNLGEQLQSHCEAPPDVVYPVEATLRKGNVPSRIRVYVERNEMISEIRKHLYNLKDEAGWVIVHGMAGFGKTVLAAEAVRDASILKEIFPGGVKWLSLGSVIDCEGAIGRAKLLSKQQELLRDLDKGNSILQTPSLEGDKMEVTKKHIQKIIAGYYPRSLLILDDVRSEKIIEAFDVHCRILVTSRIADLLSPVHNNVHSLSVSDGLTMEEGKLLLNQWCPGDISPYSGLLDYCWGSPMNIALLGGLLRKNSSDRSVQAVTDKMEQNPLKLSNTFIELSVENLPEDLKKYVAMLTVFDYDLLISSKMLCTIWNVDEVDAHEKMNVIMEHSLAQIYSIAEEADGPYYIIHDLILGNLKETIPKDKQHQYHQLVVLNYKNKCRGRFASLTDDKYVFKKLLGHIFAAEDFELLGTLLTQLEWFISNVIYGNPDELLYQYRDSVSKVPQKYQAGVQDFEWFLRWNMFNMTAYSLMRNDIVHLAFICYRRSVISDKAYYMIKNENIELSSPSLFSQHKYPHIFNIKLGIEVVPQTLLCASKCKFTEDGEKVISCSGMEVMLRDSSTGAILSNFKGHKATVTYCAFSADGKLAVSCAEDNTIKVWDMDGKCLICNFYQYGVKQCALSPDNSWLISVDLDSVIIWDVKLDKLYKINTIIVGNDEGMLSCIFSPDGTHFVTTTQNGMIMLWNFSSFDVAVTYQGHSSEITCCIFSKSGKRLATASLDHNIKVWDTLSGECMTSFSHSDVFAVLSCDFSQDEARLITGDTNGNVQVWSLQHGLLLQNLLLHGCNINCVAVYSPKTQNILSAAENGNIVIWSEESAEHEHMELTKQYHRSFSTFFAKKGTVYEPTVFCYMQNTEINDMLQLVQGNKTEVVCDMAEGKLVKGSRTEEIGYAFYYPGMIPRCWVLSMAGNKALVGYIDGTLRFYNIKTVLGKLHFHQRWTKSAHDEEVLKCYFSPDDTKIVSCSNSQQKVWDVATGEPIAVTSIAARGICVRPCIFLDDCIRMVSIQDKGILLWNTTTGKELVRFDHDSEKDAILCINLSMDNKRLIASATSGLVKVWDINGELRMLSVVKSPPLVRAPSCALSLDGSLAVAGYDDGSFKIWKVNSTEEIIKKEVTQKFTGSQYWVIDLSFSPDGSKIVTLCDGVQWWTSDGKYLKGVQLETFAKYIRFSPDFQTFVTIDDAGAMYILTSIM